VLAYFNCHSPLWAAAELASAGVPSSTIGSDRPGAALRLYAFEFVLQCAKSWDILYEHQ
jgi:hypothetical protein